MKDGCVKLYTKNHNRLQQEIKEDLNKWRHQYCKLIYRFSIISIKVLADFFEEINELNCNFIWKGKRTKIAKTIFIASYLILLFIVKLQYSTLYDSDIRGDQGLKGFVGWFSWRSCTRFMFIPRYFIFLLLFLLLVVSFSLYLHTNFSAYMKTTWFLYVNFTSGDFTKCIVCNTYFSNYFGFSKGKTITVNNEKCTSPFQFLCFFYFCFLNTLATLAFLVIKAQECQVIGFSFLSIYLSWFFNTVETFWNFKLNWCLLRKACHFNWKVIL